jgi:hypothetical protein
MPTTIIDCELAVAALPGGRLVLYYTGRVHPPAYFLIERGDDDTRERRREGPFEDEESAMAAAEEHFGELRWLAGRTD